MTCDVSAMPAGHSRHEDGKTSHPARRRDLSMTRQTSEPGMTGRGLLPVSTAWAVPGHADAPVWLTSPAASPRELPPRYGTLPRASDQTHCDEIDLLFRPLLGRPTGRLRPGYQQARRPRAAPRSEDASGPGGTARRLRSARCRRASGGLVTATRCRADVSVMTASAAPRARRCGRRSKRDPRHRSVRLRRHRVRRGRLVACHQVVAERSGDVCPAWVPRMSTGPRWGA